VTSPLLEQLVADLRIETAALVRVLEALDGPSWDVPTPSPGWLVRDQICHVAYFDDAATTALLDPERFAAERDELVTDPEFTDTIVRERRDLAPEELLAWFAAARERLADEYSRADPSVRVPWYGPSMSPAATVTSRIMETWAHGQDVVDALGDALGDAPGVARPPTRALRQVAHLGVRAFANSYRTHGRPVPESPVFVRLTSPDRESWEWGEPGAVDRVEGPAVDFCLAVTQRRHLDDLDLVVTGPVAAEWMSIAQAFADAPGPGRAPGQFSR
jgi:uncharacterized protein (TIGR03084 family)